MISSSSTIGPEPFLAMRPFSLNVEDRVVQFVRNIVVSLGENRT